MTSHLFEVFANQQTIHQKEPDSKAARAKREFHHQAGYQLATDIIHRLQIAGPTLIRRYKLDGGGRPDPQVLQTPFYGLELPLGLAVRKVYLPGPAGNVTKGYDLVGDTGADLAFASETEAVYASIKSESADGQQPAGPEVINFPNLGDGVVHGRGYNEAADLEVVSLLGRIRAAVDADITGQI